MNNTQKALKRMIRDTESKITDEELFLSSAFQKYQTSLAKAATGRSRYGLQVLMAAIHIVRLFAEQIKQLGVAHRD